MRKILPFTLPLSLPFMGWLGLELGGWWVLSGFLFIFVIHPFLDTFFGKSEEVLSDKDSSNLYSSLLWVSLPLLFLFLLKVLYKVHGNTFNHFEIFGIILSTGSIASALGVTASHELIHRRARWERGMGVGLLLMVNYAHFRVEHVFGHHKHVGTPKDHASARSGDSIYIFLGRSIILSWISAWNIEARRKSFFKNRLVHYITAQSLLVVLVFTFFKEIGLVVYLGQSAVAILIIEAINYIEHYGLERKEISPGVYEAVTEMHSWDSSHRMTNWLLFNLGRHAHHHAMPTVAYQELRPAKTDNTLKYGYSTEILLALIGKNSKR